MRVHHSGMMVSLLLVGNGPFQSRSQLIELRSFLILPDYKVPGQDVLYQEALNFTESPVLSHLVSILFVGTLHMQI